MIPGVNTNLIGKVGQGESAPGKGGGSVSGSAFSDVLKKNIDEVSRLQQDASKAVDDLATGQTQNVSGVMTAVEKADLAFKTLLAIRSKLLDAYDEIKSINV